VNTVKRALGWLCAIHVRVREDGVMEEIRRVPIGSGDPLICRAALLNDDDSPTPTKLIPATVTLSETKSPG
jgi:membrane protein involved in colicin uptake